MSYSGARLGGEMYHAPNYCRDVVARMPTYGQMLGTLNPLTTHQRLQKFWLYLTVLLCSCAAASQPMKPACPVCLRPASAPVVLDEIGVRELLAGVALEEGDLTADRDRALVAQRVAEDYARQVRLHAALGGTGGAVVAAVVAAIATWFATRSAK